MSHALKGRFGPKRPIEAVRGRIANATCHTIKEDKPSKDLEEASRQERCEDCDSQYGARTCAGIRTGTAVCPLEG